MITYSDIESVPAALEAVTRTVDDVLTPDWEACAAAMQAVSITAEPRLCYSVETSMAILAAGGDPNEIMAVMDRDATGKLLLTKLATVGVAWAHPLTVAYLDAAVAAAGLGKASRDAAVNLSAPTSRPYVEVTAEDCEKASIIADTARAATALRAKAGEIDAGVDPSNYDPSQSTVDEVRAYCDGLVGV